MNWNKKKSKSKHHEKARASTTSSPGHISQTSQASQKKGQDIATI